MLAALKNIRPNRAAVYLTSLAALLTALAPILANLDLASTAGVIAGLVGIVTVVSKWLTGWQQQEGAANEAALQLQLIEAQRTAGPHKVKLPR